LKGWRPGPL